MKKQVETRPTAIRAPNYMAWQKNEIHVIWNLLREAITIQIYGILVMESDYKTGEFSGTYNHIIELCTPPIPERGKRMPGPTMAQARRAIEQLVVNGLITRDADKNLAQGRLWLKVVTPRLKPELPKPLKEPIKDKTIKALKLGSTRINPDSPMDDEPLPTAGQSAPARSPAAAKPAAAPAPAPSGSMAEELKRIADDTKKQRRQAYFEKNGYYPEEAKAKKGAKAAPAPAGAVAGASNFKTIGALI
jgi:hypothetical protein